MKSRALLSATLLALASCSDATASRDALDRYVAIGASLTAGVASDGLVYDGQSSAYPALIARAARVPFAEARLRAPGCVPPLVVPLVLGRTLSGRQAFADVRDTTCIGRFADSVLAQNVAVPEMTTYEALRFTPDSIALASDARTRRAIEQILLDGYSQASQARAAGATFVSVELGFTEIVRAVQTGRMVAATVASYRADSAFTFVPLAVWTPVYDSLVAYLADSAQVRRGVLLRVPSPAALPALRPGSALYAARDSLRAWGVRIESDCAGSTNLVNVAKVAAAAVAATRTSAVQGLGCGDVPGAADSVLTATELASLEALRTAMNAHIDAVATARGWAVVDAVPMSVQTAYLPRVHLASTRPFGDEVSADGIHLSAIGHATLARAIAAVLLERYGFALPVSPVATLDGAR